MLACIRRRNTGFMKTGFIGCGNMGKAMISGILESGECKPQDIIVADVSDAACEACRRQFGVQTAKNNKDAADFADVLFLAVKPQYYHSVIQDIRDEITQEKIVVTIAPGKTLAWLDSEFGKPCKIIRTMPNTPAIVKAGMVGMCANAHVIREDLENVRSLCSGFAKTEVVDESMLDAVTAVSGSSPAYVFMFIEAMADAAVAEGLPRAQAYTFAAQAVYGSAKMVMETGMHPGALKDMVCSPAGTTIEAVRVLEEKGFRSAIMEAVRVCADKSRNM